MAGLKAAVVNQNAVLDRWCPKPRRSHHGLANRLVEVERCYERVAWRHYNDDRVNDSGDGGLNSLVLLAAELDRLD